MRETLRDPGCYCPEQDTNRKERKSHYVLTFGPLETLGWVTVAASTLPQLLPGSLIPNSAGAERPAAWWVEVPC